MNYLLCFLGIILIIIGGVLSTDSYICYLCGVNIPELVTGGVLLIIGIICMLICLNNSSTPVYKIEDLNDKTYTITGCCDKETMTCETDNKRIKVKSFELKQD